MTWKPINTLPTDEDCFLACDNRIAGGFHQVVYYEHTDNRLHVPDAGISYAREFFTHWRGLDLPQP